MDVGAASEDDIDDGVVTSHMGQQKTLGFEPATAVLFILTEIWRQRTFEIFGR